MRILALHGYMQNSAIMLKKMQNLFGKNKHDIVCYDGPYHINETAKGWWLLPSKELFNKPHTYNIVSDEYRGMFDLFSTMSHTTDERDYDLVVGFSQGAVTNAYGG